MQQEQILVLYGYSLNEIEDTGYAWMLLYWKVKVLERPRWNEELTVKTWPRKFDKVSSWRDFEVYDEKDNLVVVATTNWVLIDAKKQKPARITEEMVNAYGMVSKSVFAEELSGKLKPPENEEKVYEYTATRRDIDSNHHVNNVMYLEFAYDAFPKDMELNFNNFEIYYKKQIKLGETVSIYLTKYEKEYIVSVKSKNGENLHAILKFTKF